MPLSLDHPAVIDVRERFNASHDDLMDAAMALGLNVAIVDDLIVLGEQDERFSKWLAAVAQDNGDLQDSDN